MRKWTYPRAEGDLYSRSDSFAKAGFRDFSDRMSAISFHIVLPVELIVVQGRHQVDSLLQEFLDGRIVQYTSMLDGVDSGIETVLHAFASKGMAGHFPAFFVCL